MIPINGQRIFSLNEDDYWVGEDLESVMIAARSQTGCTDEELFCKPYELSEVEINTMIRYDEETGNSLSFQGALIADLGDERTVTPYCFASSNC
jgi:hypothetical protein